MKDDRTPDHWNDLEERHAFVKARLAEMCQSVTDNGRHPQIIYDLILLFQVVDSLIENEKERQP